MQLCRFCGFYNDDEAVYCSSCDSPLSPSTNPRIPKELAEAIARSDGERAEKETRQSIPSAKVRFEPDNLAPPPIPERGNGSPNWGGNLNDSRIKVKGEDNNSGRSFGNNYPNSFGNSQPKAKVSTEWERGASFIDTATPTKALPAANSGNNQNNANLNVEINSVLSSNTPTELVPPRSSSSDYVVHQISIEELDRLPEQPKGNIRQTLYYGEEREQGTPRIEMGEAVSPDSGEVYIRDNEILLEDGDEEFREGGGTPLYGGWKILSTGLLVVLLLLSIGFFSAVIYMFFFSSDDGEGDISKEIAKITSKESGTTGVFSKKDGSDSLSRGLKVEGENNFEMKLEQARKLFAAYNFKGASEIVKELKNQVKDEGQITKLSELSQKIVSEEKIYKLYSKGKALAKSKNWREAIKILSSIPGDSLFHSRASKLERKLKENFVYPKLKWLNRRFRRRKFSVLLYLEELRELLKGDSRIEKLASSLYSKSTYLFSRCNSRCKRRYRGRSRYSRIKRKRCTKRCNYRYPTEKFIKKILKERRCAAKCWEEKAEKYRKICHKYYPKRRRKRMRCLALWKKKIYRRVCNRRCKVR